MTTVSTSLPLPVSEQFASLLAEQLKDVTSNAVTLNFRDESYDAESGGFRPVEIRLERHLNQWHIQYITEFCYVGIGPFAELTKSLDFDFGCGIFQSVIGECAIEKGTDMYVVWEPNFLSYWQEMKAFTLTISPD
ncbi:hypothetical protein GCM10011369_06070 [Neiella marina]|uniref:DUF2787 domain-containing protein n=1 Tax=Neiella marina TaxID=508461 RepID=A0A8J2U2P5_9GAMM|nr:DUF2787 family protein [Neiella marina]GGA67218.1 hypothetical protein GCM10011369_06070 [Neiella marina]